MGRSTRRTSKKVETQEDKDHLENKTDGSPTKTQPTLDENKSNEDGRRSKSPNPKLDNLKITQRDDERIVEVPKDVENQLELNSASSQLNNNATVVDLW